MLCLALRISLAHCRARQPITQFQLMKQSLALAHTQVNLVAILQTPSERFSIPQIGVDARLDRGVAQPGAHLLHLFGR